MVKEPRKLSRLSNHSENELKTIRREKKENIKILFLIKKITTPNLLTGSED
jgi:hypothetical protein